MSLPELNDKAEFDRIGQMPANRKYICGHLPVSGI